MSQPSSPVNQSGPSSNQPTEPGGLFSVRAMVSLVAAVVVGCVAGALAYLAGQPVAGAVLVGLGAAGATILGVHKLMQ